MTTAATKDLVVLVPDRSWEAVLRTLLEKRSQALAIRSCSHDIFVHPQRDPGVFRGAGTFLAPFRQQYEHALVIIDQEWEGAPDADGIQKTIQDDLNHSAWKDRSSVVVVVPELEAWVWTDSPHLPEILGWNQGSIFAEIERCNFERNALGKPMRPKEALDSILRTVKKPRSSALFSRLAEKVSLDRCQDPSFQRARQVLQQWFPRE
mgnify:CR=1 FL=1